MPRSTWSSPGQRSKLRQSGDIRLNNAPGFADPAVDSALAAGGSTLDPAKRKATYDQLQQRVLDLSPLIFLNWREQSYAARKSVTGFQPLPGFLNFQSGIMLAYTSVSQ